MRLYLPIFIVVLIDQSTKMWISRNLAVWESRDIIGIFLRFTHVKNPGIAFGISVGEYKILMTLLSIAATLFIAYIHWRERYNHRLLVISIGLILGGAIGNMIDRSSIFFSSTYIGVVDFIDVGTESFRWYTFNIADSAVTIGIILYLVYSLIEEKPEIIEHSD